MRLHENENEILTSNGGKVILTNQRIQMNDKEWGRSHSITIFLEDISSIQVIYKTNPLFLFLSVLCVVLLPLSFFSSSNFYTDTKPTQILFTAAVICLTVWLVSKHRTISIHPDGGRPLEFTVGKMSKEEIEEFVEEVQLAKMKRMHEIFGH